MRCAQHQNQSKNEQISKRGICGEDFKVNYHYGEIQVMEKRIKEYQDDTYPAKHTI